MSIERSLFRSDTTEKLARSHAASAQALSVAKDYFERVRVWTRKAMAPGGITGVVMALVFVVVTDASLLLMREIRELPPVSLTFLIPIVVAAIRWGTLSAAITAFGGAVSLTWFFYSPFYLYSTESRSRVLGIVVFLIVSLVLGYLAAKTRRDAARALKRENEIRDLYDSRSVFPPPVRRSVFSRRCRSIW